MALFLQESIQEEEIYLSIEEAYEGLIEATMDMQDLTEGLLQADFIIHEECKILTEAEADNKKINFLVKALQHIKSFIVKLGKQIKAFIIKTTQYVKSIWNKLLIKLNLVKEKEIAVPVGFSSLAQKISASLAKNEKLVLDKNTDMKQLETTDNNIKQLLSKFSILLKIKKDQTEKVPVSVLTPVFNYLANDISSTGIINSSAIQETEIKVLEKKLDDAKRDLTTNPDNKRQENNIGDISKKINATNSKNKFSIKLTKTIGVFAKIFAAGLSVAYVAKVLKVANDRNSNELNSLANEERNREFRDTQDRMDAEFEKERNRIDSDFKEKMRMDGLVAEKNSKRFSDSSKKIQDEIDKLERNRVKNHKELQKQHDIKLADQNKKWADFNTAIGNK